MVAEYFLPLMKGGKSHETIDYMISELVAKNHSDLLMIGYYFASLVFIDEEERQWLTERFGEVKEIIEESWVYQANIQKGFEQGLEKGREEGRENGREQGREQGRQQGLQTAQQTAIGIIARRFPELELLARAIITVISDLNQLQMLTIELSVASSQEDAKRLLLASAA